MYVYLYLLFFHLFFLSSPCSVTQLRYCNNGNRCLSRRDLSSNTQKSHLGKSSSTDDLSFRSASLFPNFKPKANVTVDVRDSFTDVVWTLPIADIEEMKRYSFTVKLKLGPNVDSGDVFAPQWSFNFARIDNYIVVK